MNIFGMGSAELIAIFIIMLVVAGPKRMIQWAYILGQYTAKLRGMWSEIMQIVQQELDQAGVDVQVPKEIPTRTNLRKMTDQVLKPVAKPLQEAIDETGLKQTGAELQAVMDEAGLQSRSTPSKSTLAAGGNGRRVKANREQTDTPTEPPQDFGTWSGTETKGQ